MNRHTQRKSSYPQMHADARRYIRHDSVICGNLRQSADSSSVRGFTLTELLVSIALIVVLMLAVNMIFKTTADTVGVGQTISASTRDLRAIQTTIKRDLEGAAMSDGPFFMIRSSIQPTFLNQKDQQASKSYTATGTAADLASILNADPTASGIEAAQAVTNYGLRAFRQDMLGFFSRGLFQRQTGDDGTFAASMSGNEAYVWYGHLKLPDGSGANPPNCVWPGYTDWYNCWTPATNSNPNNFYASQWCLGRVAMLMCQPVPVVATYDADAASAGPNDRFIYAPHPSPSFAGQLQRQYYIGYAAADATLSPFAISSRNTINNQSFPNTWPWVYSARYDLAGISIANYRQRMSANTTAATWTGNSFGYRFNANPFPARPLTSASAAQAVPLLLNNCSQFIVEYAGDFLTQDAAGAATAATPDGTIDYIIDPTTSTRKIRWYGLPRDTFSSGSIVGISAAGKNGSDLLNVVPLRDVLQSFGQPAAPFERLVPVQQANYTQTATTGYSAFNPSAANKNGGNTGNCLAPYEQYVCAWGPDTAASPMPKMIRILVKLEDPIGRTDLPWQEMIFTLPQQ